jgi:hypothetical protein
MNKRLKNKMLAGVMTLAFVTMMVAGCNKYDKMDILGGWEIDLKEAKGLTIYSATESIHFNSGAGQKYSELHIERESANGKWDRWEIEGIYERKNNKITLSERKKPSGEVVPSVTYKYRIEGDKLIFIIKDEGFKNDEKIYTKKKNVVVD